MTLLTGLWQSSNIHGTYRCNEGDLYRYSHHDVQCNEGDIYGTAMTMGVHV